MVANNILKYKVYYRPLDAAIRWSNLSHIETFILRISGCGPWPPPETLSQWPLVQFNLERLRDGVINYELPICKDGVRQQNLTTSDPDLTLRHVDLKAWMQQYYPVEKPDFLFDGIEKHLYPDARHHPMQGFLLEQESIKAQCNLFQEIVDKLEDHLQKPNKDMDTRSERTYLSIIGAMLSLIQQAPTRTSPIKFPTLESVIDAVLTYFPDYPGLSERTLRSKFAAARRHMAQQ